MSRSRREFLRQTSLAASVAALPAFLSTSRARAATIAANDRLRIGSIGVGGRGSGIARNAREFGDILAVCDVDSAHAEKAAADPKLGAGKAEVYADYRKLLDRNDIDVVTIGTPDHWHSKICVDAMRGGQGCLLRKAADADDR